MRNLDESAPTMMQLTWAMAGPVIWVAHFSLVYAVQTVICTGALGEAKTAFAPAAVALTAAAVGALLALIGYQLLMARHGRGTALNHPFLGHLQMVLAVLSLLGVAWGTLPAAALPVCAPSAH